MGWLEKKTKEILPRRSTMVFGVEQQWLADLVDMQKFQRYNSGFGYLFCVIYVFFQICLCGPHNKKQKTVVKLWMPSK